MTEKEQFVAMIAADRLNPNLYRVYADWLDDHGEYDSATEQRRWADNTPQIQEAEDFLRELVDGEATNWGETPITYEMLLEAGRRYQERGQIRMTQLGSSSLQDNLCGKTDRFWEAWSLVTGKEGTGENPVSCSC